MKDSGAVSPLPRSPGFPMCRRACSGTGRAAVAAGSVDSGPMTCLPVCRRRPGGRAVMAELPIHASPRAGVFACVNCCCTSQAAGRYARNCYPYGGKGTAHLDCEHRVLVSCHSPGEGPPACSTTFSHRHGAVDDLMLRGPAGVAKETKSFSCKKPDPVIRDNGQLQLHRCGKEPC